MTSLPATVQLSTLSQEIGVLTEQLKPVEQNGVSKYLLSMRKAGMSLSPGIKPEDLDAVYGYALSDVPAFGLKRAVEKIIKGEYEIERGFIPRPPELAAMARAEARTIREDLIRLREKERAIRELQAKPQPVSEGTKERVRAMLGQFRSSREAQMADRGKRIDGHISTEQAEYWRKIDAMPDARHVTAEHLAFRRNRQVAVHQQYDRDIDDPGGNHPPEISITERRLDNRV